MAGSSNLANGLQPPDFASGGAKLPKVSGHMPKYSHFWETAAGDWVRSSLHGVAAVVFQFARTIVSGVQLWGNNSHGLEIVAERERETVRMKRDSSLIAIAKARVWASEGWSVTIVVSDEDASALVEGCSPSLA